MPGITLLGLGPGNPFHLTREAWDVLTAAQEIYVRTKQHPTILGLPPGIAIESFDHLYEAGETFESVYSQIVDQVIKLGQREQGVLYAVPGDPYVAEATGPEIVRQARLLGLPMRIINGISFLEPVFSALGLDPLPRLLLQDAIELSQQHIASFPSDVPVLIAQIYSQLIAAEVKMTLNSMYPDEHPVSLVHSAGTDSQIVEEIHLFEIDRSKNIGLTTVLFLPPLVDGTSFEAFQEIVAQLRAPGGCPWDREQTHKSLRPHLLEEAYEALTALDTEDPVKMAEEFGDLLLQVVLNVQIAMEEGNFNMTDVLRGIRNKIIRRHPHVFGDTNLVDVPGVLKNWEILKAEERGEAGKGEGMLEGVPLTLPALTQAQEYQDRAARVGFDWPSIDGVLEKIIEEIQEMKSAANEDDYASEMGDLFFSLVNLARWKHVDAESVLRATNLRFKKRFNAMEKEVVSTGSTLSGKPIEELEELWQNAKKKA